MQAKPLNGKIAVVTGASRGTGTVIARTLKEAGAKVAILARPSDRLTEAAKSLDTLALPADLTNPDDIRAAFKTLKKTYGGLDILINNAAFAYIHKVEDFSDEEITRELGTNLIGPIYCIREAVPLMRARGGGDIVNVSSEVVRMCYPRLALYASAKAGLEMLSTALRTELRPDKIRVTIARLGIIAGGEFGRHWDPKDAEAFQEEARAGGQLRFSGEKQMAGETVATAILDLVKLPRDANIDMLELRAAI